MNEKIFVIKTAFVTSAFLVLINVIWQIAAGNNNWHTVHETNFFEIWGILILTVMLVTQPVDQLPYQQNFVLKNAMIAYLGLMLGMSVEELMSEIPDLEATVRHSKYQFLSIFLFATCVNIAQARKLRAQSHEPSLQKEK